MAAFTSKASGNWSSSGQTTWNETGVPGSGDTVTLSHAVTVDVNTTIGTSPAEGNVVVQINTAGHPLTIAAGVTFTVRGDIRSQNAGIVMSAGSVLEFDASAAGSPSTTNYEWQMGTSAGSNARLTTNGTSGSRCTVRSNSGGGSAFIRWGQSSGFQAHYTCAYTDFVRMNNPSNSRGIEVAQGSGSGGDISFDHCTFDSNCGSVYFASSTPADTGLTFTDCIFSNTQDTNSLRMITANPTTGARTISRCSFAATMYGIESGFTVEDCVLDASFDHGNTNTWTLLDGCFVRVPVSSGAAIRGNASNNYWLADGFNDNPHIVTPRSVGAKTFEGNIIDFTGTFPTDAGNSFYGEGDWTVQNNIFMKSAVVGNYGIGTITFAAPTCNIYHNTFYATDYTGGILVGDTGATTGTYPNVKSNLFWVDPSATDGKAVSAIGAGLTTDDCVTPANCTHNGLVNMHASPYEGQYPTTQPGANDIRIDGIAETDVFVDPARNIATWAVSRGSVSATYAGQVADARTYLKADPTLVADLLAHVRAGFAPRDARFQDAGHDGVTTGAVEGEFTVIAAGALGGAWPFKRITRPATFAPGIGR